MQRTAQRFFSYTSSLAGLQELLLSTPFSPVASESLLPLLLVRISAPLAIGS